MPFNWKRGQLVFNLNKLPEDINVRFREIVDKQAKESEAFMKSFAHWIDRTGAARAGLFAKTTHQSVRHTIILGHLVSYGIWLETRKSFHGRYAIVTPTLKIAGEALMHNLEKLLGKSV